MNRTMRRQFIEIALRRAQPGAGTLPDVLRRRTAVVVWPDFTAVLSPIRWAVVGAVAARHYMPERATHESISPSPPGMRRRRAASCTRPAMCTWAS